MSDYEKTKRAIEKHAERLKKSGVAKTSQEALDRARRVQRESDANVRKKDR